MTVKPAPCRTTEILIGEQRLRRRFNLKKLPVHLQGVNFNVKTLTNGYLVFNVSKKILNLRLQDNSRA